MHTQHLFREHGEIFWAALDQLQLTDDADLLAPLANALRGRQGTARIYAHIDWPVISRSVDPDTGEEKIVRSQSLYPRSFEWKDGFDLSLSKKLAETLKDGLKKLKTAKKHDRNGAETKTPVLTACDAAAYQECVEFVDLCIAAETVATDNAPDAEAPSEPEA